MAISAASSLVIAPIDLIEDGLVACHPFVVGELACGHLAGRAELLALLQRLPALLPVSHDDALRLVEAQKLAGSGLGWVDVHLLAAARVAGADLWTVDRQLKKVADRLHIAADASRDRSRPRHGLADDCARRSCDGDLCSVRL